MAKTKTQNKRPEEFYSTSLAQAYNLIYEDSVVLLSRHVLARISLYQCRNLHFYEKKQENWILGRGREDYRCSFSIGQAPLECGFTNAYAYT